MKNSLTENTRSFLSFFLITIAIVLAMKLIFNLLALSFIYKVWDLDTQVIYNDLQNGTFNFIYAHKILALFDQIGTFLIPSILISLVFKFIQPNYSYPSKKDFIKLGYIFIILIGSTQLLVLISIQIGYDFFSESIQSYLKTQQDFNQNLQEKFIENNFRSFSFNVLLLAIIPAIGEELFFRGIIQKIFIGIFKNSLAGIIITSVIFGLLHFQIDNLLAIIFASIIFGLIYESSKNILLTIILHFSFNLFALITMQIIKLDLLSESKIDFAGNYLLIPLSLVAAIILVKRKEFWKKQLFLPVD
jgi:membrane protease YdiL (CAAX protease family)